MNARAKIFLTGPVLLVWLVLKATAGSGALDLTYTPALNGAVNVLALQANGQLVIGGSFTTVNGTTRTRIARLYADGSLDTAFQNSQSGASSTINALTAQSDGRIVIGGSFTSVNGTTRYAVARMNVNGTLDGSFVPSNLVNSVSALAVQNDNKVIVGGNNFLYRLNADGSLDATFYNNTSGSFTISAIAVQTDGKIIIGGAFSSYSGTTRNNVARLYSDGTIDGTFLNGLAGAVGTVRCVQVQPDGKILIGGDFSSVNGASRNHVARLTNTGALDTGFSGSAVTSGSVYAMTLQPDGSVVIAGNLTAYYYNNGTYTYSYNIARLYADGTMDNTFVCPNNLFNTTYSIALQSDGGIMAGGNFSYSSTNRYLARVYGNLYPPEFTLQPTNRNVAVGTNLTFTTHVGNPTTTYFQWRKNGSDIAGATGMSYSLNNVQLADAGIYAVFASNGAGGNTSSNAVLQVGIAPAITQQPASLVVTQGQPASFTVGASGTPLNYFWKKTGTFIPGATNAALTFASAVYTNAGSYVCQVSNFLGSVTSVAATLTVLSPPTILTPLVGQTVGVGSNLTMSVTANGTTPLVYQWFKDGNALTPLTNSSFTLTNAQTTNSGGYSVVITNALGGITSSVVAVSVIYFPPSIVSQPTSGNYPAGSNFNLTVVVTSSIPFAFQWNTNSVPIPGAVAATYSVTNAQTNNSGAYTVIITNLAGSVTSSVALVNVGYAPVITQQPLSITNVVGDTNGFGVSVFGSSPLLYQWFMDGMALPNATNSSLMLPDLQVSQIGYYSVSVTNAFGGVVSSNAALNLVGHPFAPWHGLLAWYPFNGDATDASGNGLDGVTNGGAIFAPDRLGGSNACLALDGSSAYVSVSDPGGFLNFDARSNNYSVTAWVKLKDTNNDYTFLIDRGTTQNQPSSYTLQFLNADDRFQAGVWDGASNVSVINALTVPQPGQWYQLVLVVTNQQLRLFVNGTDETAPDWNGGVLPTGFGSTKNTDGARNFGRFAGAIYGNYLNGDLDEVRIYNRALSAGDVGAVYAAEAGLPVITQQPQAQTKTLGGTAAFSVLATAQNPLAYQWQVNGTNLVAATNATLLLTNLQYADAGNYTVTVGNALAGIASSNALLTVLIPAQNFVASQVDGTVQIHLTGRPGGYYALQCATNLAPPVAWQMLITSQADALGNCLFLDTNLTGGQKFYRAVGQ